MNATHELRRAPKDSNERRASAWFERSSRCMAIAFVFVTSILVGGCGGVGPGGREVGGACQTDRDCARTCITGDSHYPGGICSARCSNDSQCPGGTACVDDSGGICAVLCSGANSCSGFGRGFVCDRENRQGAPGEVTVCRVP